MEEIELEWERFTAPTEVSYTIRDGSLVLFGGEKRGVAFFDKTTGELSVKEVPVC